MAHETGPGFHPSPSRTHLVFVWEIVRGSLSAFPVPSWQSTPLVWRAYNQSCLRKWCLLGTERIGPESTEKSEKNEQERGNLTWVKEAAGGEGKVTDGRGAGRGCSLMAFCVEEGGTWGSETGWLSCVQLCDSVDLDSPWNSPGHNTGVGSLSLLQGIFPAQGWNPGLLHCRQTLSQLSQQGSPPGGVAPGQ